MKNIKIGQRLAMGFGAVLALLVLLALMASYSLSEAHEDELKLVEMGRRAMVADEWVASTRLNVTRVMALAKSGNNPEVDAYFKPLIAQTTQRINELQKDLQESIDTEQGKAMLVTIGTRIALPEAWVFFGILHAIALFSLLALTDIADHGNHIIQLAVGFAN